MHPQLLAFLNERADEKGTLSYVDYLHCALYAPEVGYYQQNKPRVGRSSKTDFYTARTFGTVFEKLLIASVTDLLEGEKLSDYTFIEIGAEPEQSLFQEIDVPFFEIKTYMLGDTPVIPPKAIVFANELFDAQPFHRLIYLQREWRELGVSINRDTLDEVVLDELTPEMQNIMRELPYPHKEGYRLDVPLLAETLLSRLVQSLKEGLLVIFDYGKFWSDLIHNYPDGTARAYLNHRQHNDLLRSPGEQDITCHLCWDRLKAVLQDNNFESVRVERQESFFIHHAPKTISRIIEKDAFSLEAERQYLKELLHPTLMGHAFQVLWGKRLFSKNVTAN